MMQASSEARGDVRPAAVAWVRHHPRPEDLFLTEPTKNWLDALPKGVRPRYLLWLFPRIVNEPFRLWDRPVALDLYFAEKESSPRDGRAGSPPLIREELLVLHLYPLRTRGSLAQSPVARHDRRACRSAQRP